MQQNAADAAIQGGNKAQMCADNASAKHRATAKGDISGKEKVGCTLMNIQIGPLDEKAKKRCKKTRNKTGQKYENNDNKLYE